MPFDFLSLEDDALRFDAPINFISEKKQDFIS